MPSNSQSKTENGPSPPQVEPELTTQAGPGQKYPSRAHPVIYFPSHIESYIFFFQKLPVLLHNSEHCTEVKDASMAGSCLARGAW